MKKLLLFATLLFFTACSDDDSPTNDCNCMGQWGQQGEVEATIETEINCETGEAEPYQAGPDYVFMGCIEE